VVKDKHTLAERLHVSHIMTGQQNCGIVAFVIRGNKFANTPLHRHVKANRWLVEKEHARAVQQRAGDLDFHPFAQRKIAHRLLDQPLQIKQFDKFIACAPVVRLGNTINGAIQLERIQGRQIPLELVAIAHNQRNLTQKILLAPRWRMAQNTRHAAGRIEQPGEYLQRGRLPRAVGSQKANYLPRLDRKRNGIDRVDGARLASHQAF